MIRLPKKPQGFLLITAVILIVIVGIIASTVLYLSKSNIILGAYQNDHNKAVTLANSAIQIAFNRLNNTDLNNRVLCVQDIDSISTDDINDISYQTVAGMGYYLLSGQLYTTSNPYTEPDERATLSSDITAGSAVIPVSSIANFPSYGEIQIGREAIDYTGTSSSSCGAFSPPCFTGITRGADSTVASSHESDARIAQNQCEVTASSYFPDYTNATGRAVIQASSAQVPRAWIAADDNSGFAYLAYFNGVNVYRYNPIHYSLVPDAAISESTSWMPRDYNAVYAVNASDVWMVGDKSNSDLQPNIIHWDGRSWVNATLTNGIIASSPETPPIVHLYAVTCASASDCWAVGQSRTFIHYKKVGSRFQWVYDSSVIDTSGSNAIPNKTIYGVSCISANNCWAVGQDSGGALFAHWNGTDWSRATVASGEVNSNVISTKDLRAISCLSNGDCYAVGQNNSSTMNVNEWNGSQWSRMSAPSISKQLWGVSCNITSAGQNACWAVGLRYSSTGLFLDLAPGASSWVRATPAASVENQHLTAVSCLNHNDCIAVGYGPSMAYYNGTQWVALSDVALPSTTLRGVSMIGNKVRRPEFWIKQ